MSERRQRTLGDYVAVAICPALIMVLVASLLLFLLEILYVGRYTARLQWTLCAFVFAAVLIARISMESGIAERAGIYGVALAVVTFLTVNCFIDYPAGSPLAEFRWFVNGGLIALVWWCAHRLTRDCTHVDEDAESTGAGLLQLAGLDPDAPADQAGDESPESNKAVKSKSRRQEPTGLAGWWRRYRQYREKARKAPHAPGVWVIYFSLAALPLFGLGQTAIPADDLARRRYAFWLLCLYVASGLALLLTTSYLGLRRYLRQRGLRMPVAMTGGWLTMGGAMIAVLLLLGAFLPRPNAEYSLVDLKALVGSPERNASRVAPPIDGAGKKTDGSSAARGDDKDDDGEQASGKQGDEDGETRQGEKSQGQGSDGKEKSSGQAESQSDGNAKSSGDQSNDKQAGGQKSQQAKGRQGKDQRTSQNGRSPSASSSGRRTPSEIGSLLRRLTPPPVRNFFAALLPLLKWLAVIVIGVVVAFIVLRAALRFLANFTIWARQLLEALQRLWQSLFGWWPTATLRTGPEAPEEMRPPPAPFRVFTNPFAAGAERWTPEQLVRYSFEALEAWANERGLGRQVNETPMEFGRRVCAEAVDLEAMPEQLTGLYARAAYAPGRLPREAVQVVREFWQRLDTQRQPAPV